MHDFTMQCDGACGRSSPHCVIGDIDSTIEGVPPLCFFTLMRIESVDAKTLG